MPESDGVYWIVIVVVQVFSSFWLFRSLQPKLLSTAIGILFAAGCGAFYFLANTLYSHAAAGGHINFGFAPISFFMLLIRALPVSAAVGLLLFLATPRWERRHIEPRRM